MHCDRSKLLGSAKPKCNAAKGSEHHLSNRHIDLRISLILIAVQILRGSIATAQAMPSQDFIRHTMANSPFREQLSTSTSLVKIHTNSSIYYIPRNYIVYPDPSYPILRVTFPGFQPFTEVTRPCLQGPKLQAGCFPLELRLNGGDGPGPGGRAFNNQEMLENLLRNLNFRKIAGPFGYTVYSVGPKNAETRVYTKSEPLGLTYVNCFSQNNINTSVCDDSMSLRDGNAVRFFYSEDRISDIQEIEMNVRKLFDNFSVKKDK